MRFLSMQHSMYSLSIKDFFENFHRILTKPPTKPSDEAIQTHFQTLYLELEKSVIGAAKKDFANFFLLLEKKFRAEGKDEKFVLESIISCLMSIINNKLKMIPKETVFTLPQCLQEYLIKIEKADNNQWFFYNTHDELTSCNIEGYAASLVVNLTFVYGCEVDYYRALYLAKYDNYLDEVIEKNNFSVPLDNFKSEQIDPLTLITRKSPQKLKVLPYIKESPEEEHDSTITPFALRC